MYYEVVAHLASLTALFINAQHSLYQHCLTLVMLSCTSLVLLQFRNYQNMYCYIYNAHDV